MPPGAVRCVRVCASEPPRVRERGHERNRSAGEINQLGKERMNSLAGIGSSCLIGVPRWPFRRRPEPCWGAGCRPDLSPNRRVRLRETEGRNWGHLRPYAEWSATGCRAPQGVVGGSAIEAATLVVATLEG